jgi:O-antigen/teichoic acid export membrane protein
MLPIYTSQIYLPDRAAFGDFTLIYTFIAFVTMVYLYGMDSALLRYFFSGKYERKDVYSSGFWAVSVNSILVTLILISFNKPIALLMMGNEQYGIYVIFAALIMLFDGIGNLPYLALRAEEKSIHYAGFRVGRFLLEISLNILFVVALRKGVMGILYANVIAAFINLLALLPFQKKYLRFTFHWKLYKELALFALPLLPNSLAYLVVEVSDKYLMSVLLDKDTLGMYGANYRFGAMLLLLVIAFRTAWQPFFLKVAKQSDAKKIYAKVFTYFTIVGVAVVMMGSYFIEYFVKIPLAENHTIMGKNYWEGIKIIPIILVSYLFYGFYVHLTAGIYIRKKTKLMIIFSGLAALTNVLSNLYLMPKYGIMGAAFATLLSYITMVISIFIAAQKIYKIPYEYGRIVFLIAYLVVSISLLYGFDLSIYWRLVIVFASPVIFYAAGFFQKRELEAIKGLFK